MALALIAIADRSVAARAVLPPLRQTTRRRAPNRHAMALLFPTRSCTALHRRTANPPASAAGGNGDCADEAVASPRNIDDEPIAVSSIAQRATQCRNMNGKIGRLDKNIRPNASYQLLLTNQLTWSLKQDSEDFESTASEGRWLVAFKQKKLRREQAKRPE